MLTLHYHPLASYCWKVLVGLYEAETPFQANLVDLSDPQARVALEHLWPIGKFPVLEDPARGVSIAESTTILEYVARHYPGRAALIPADLDAAHEARALDRFFDLHVHEQMQKIVDDRLRPADAKDPLGVARARERLAIAYGMVDGWMAERRWAVGDAFTMADCAAAPALYYAARVVPLEPSHPLTSRYLERLKERPSFARVLAEAEPFAHMFPE